MRRLLYLIVLIFGISSINAQEPLVKFYLQDGNEKVYNIEDIDELNFIKAEISSFFTIYRNNDSLNAIFDTKYIVKINFSPDKSKLNVIFDGNQYNYDLSNIDSITIKQKEQRFINVQINPELPCLKDLTVSSFADYNKTFNENGTASLIIADDGLPQLVMVSDKENNLIGMGLAKSTDSLIHINGISTAAAIVFQNVYMMGVPLDTLTDDVVDYIMDLGEVISVGSQIEDSLKICSINTTELSLENNAIIREAFLKTYESITGEKYGLIESIRTERKENITDQILNTPLKVYPPEASGLIVTAERDNNNIVWAYVENTKRRHINIREGNKGNQIIKIGPNKPILDNMISYIFDKILHNNKITIKKNQQFDELHTVGMSLKLPFIEDKHSYPYSDEELRDNALIRTASSIFMGGTETIISSVIPVTLDDNWINFTLELYNGIYSLFSIPDIYDKINNNDISGALIELCKELQKNELFWRNIFTKSGIFLTEESLSSITGMANIL